MNPPKFKIDINYIKSKETETNQIGSLNILDDDELFWLFKNRNFLDRILSFTVTNLNTSSPQMGENSNTDSSTNQTTEKEK